MPGRSPICTIVGHVDHGKTSLLDRIRGTAVAAGEAGGITQSIGASIIPISIIRKICGPLLEKLRLNFTIPGLLFIDTPGHAAFTNLRKRGGALADIAVLVVDINEGFKPQTLESIEILKNDKTPFVVAATKFDLIMGWQQNQSIPLIDNIKQQAQRVQEIFDTKIYELVGKFYELGFQVERFDRVSDYTQQLAIVPVSSVTGEGIAELLMIIAGLAQRYLEKELHVEEGGPAKGTVLEVREEEGLGTTIDVILYAGTLRVGEILVVGGLDKALVTKVRALLEPLPLVEMRVKKAKFQNVHEVSAATGVKISAPDLQGAVAGMPLRSCEPTQVDTVSEEVQKEVKSVLIETDQEGIIIKADTLGSLEAMLVLLREHQIPIRSASIGKITKKDIAEAQMMGEKNPFYSVILGFNVALLPEAEEYLVDKDIKVVLNEVIYHIIDQYEKWKVEKKKAVETAELDKLVRGGKLRLLPGYVFRQSNPAVMGVEILAGRVRANEPLMDASGKRLTAVKSLQEEKETINSVEAGQQAALAMDDVVVGRQIHEGDILYTDVPDGHFRKMKELKHYLKKADVELLKEIAEIKRKESPAWGM